MERRQAATLLGLGAESLEQRAGKMREMILDGRGVELVGLEAEAGGGRGPRGLAGGGAGEAEDGPSQARRPSGWRREVRSMISCGATAIAAGVGGYSAAVGKCGLMPGCEE